MYIILGATGHVGSAVANALLKQKESVTIVTHDAQKTADWQQKGAKVATVDISDTEALHQIFSLGKRLFLLNPPANPSTDTTAEERKSLACILSAVDGSGLKKIVAESTYGAQPGDQLGDLGVLYEMEQALARQSIPFSIIRAAYYMSNWDASLQTAQQEGIVHTFYPPDFNLPMVAPYDIGQLAARLLTEPINNTGLYFMEGPARYSSAEVAMAFTEALRIPVKALQTPHAQWARALTGLGFSDKAAISFANMTATTLDKQYPMPEAPEQGVISLQEYINELVQKSQREST